MKNLKRLILNSLLVLLAPAAGWSIAMTGGNFEMTKDLAGATGPAQAPTVNSADYALTFAWGEPVAGT